MNKQRKLSLFDFTMIMVGLVIGMGIFRTASTAAVAANHPIVYVGAWIAGGLIALCGGLTYAEIGSRYPVTGGFYKVIAHTYHPSISFSINCIILISNAASTAAIALIGSGYLTQAFFDQPVSDFGKSLIAMAAILIFYLVNLSGIKTSAKTQNILMIIKIGMLLLLISALFFPAVHFKGDVVTIAHPADWKAWAKAFGLALIAVSFTFGGYQQTINFGNDVRNPAKNMPKGIFLGMAIILVLYLLVNLSYYKVLGYDDLKQQNEIAGVVVSRLLGNTAGTLFSAFLFLSVLAYVNVLLMSNPRVMYAMSEEGVLPKIFMKSSVKRNVYIVSLSVFSLMGVIILFFANTFEKLLSFVIFLECFGMITSASAIFMLRKKTSHLNATGIYSMKLYPLIPVIFIAAYAFVAFSIMIDTPRIALTGVMVWAAFMMIYFLTKKTSNV